MQIDAFTALFSYVAANLISVVSVAFVLYANKGDRRGVRSFVSMFILMIAGAVLAMFRGLIPVYLTITLSNLFLTISRYCMLRGLSRLLDRKYSFLILAVSFIATNAGLAYFTYFDFNLQMRILIFTTFVLITYLMAYIMVVGEKTRNLRGRALMVVLLFLNIMINSARIVLNFIHTGPNDDLLSLQLDPITILANGLLSLVFVVAVAAILNGLHIEKLARLTEEKGFFANIYEISPIPIFVARGNDRILSANQSICDLLMQSREILEKSNWLDVMVPDQLRKHMRDSIHDGSRGPRVYHTTKVLKYDGTSVPVEMFIEVHFDEFDVLDHYFVFLHDLTSIRKAQDEAMRAEIQKNTILSNIPGFTYRCYMDRNWTMTELSEAFTELTGYEREELLNNKEMSFNDIIDEEFRDEVWETWNQCYVNKIPYIGEYKIVRADGSKMWVWEHGRVVDDSRGDKIVLEGFITDVSARKRLEEKADQMEEYLRNQQKLEAIGTLAAGVAHEINNPVNGIMNYAQLISDMGADGETKEYANEIIRESERVSGIVRSLLKFAGKQDMGPRLMSMETPFMQTIDLFKATIRKSNIDIKVTMERNLPEIMCDCPKMQQVLMNLLTNAKDSLNLKYPGYDGDKIILIHAGTLTDENGEWLRISVEDHGTGISDAVKSHIFEPFFTTKDRTQGTGLGLAISYGIVKDHKGRLTYETEVGKFTRFHVDLPV